MNLATLGLFTVLTISTSAAPTVPLPPICGTIHLQGGKTQVIYGDACYGITGKALSATVFEECGCDFSQWDTCDAGKLKGRSITGVPITEAKGYWCNLH
ncbi:hypothetical protein BKA58DRAFT_179564 [Alternaria rosae]|uniref:uncharacterized protein n=1 Tax=Alternaria rosae TaxID=1187941 RepID=UPI001E8D8BD6|nr:uncharacterized protein BKA58DRAFT_179564 [Alternaria rosae]KAH6870575.1 hypothetical protein BKA58DRAFT_179564 [Alternaria rosae]